MVEVEVAPSAQGVLKFMAAVLDSREFDPRSAAVAMASAAQALVRTSSDRRVLAHVLRQLAAELDRDAADDGDVAATASQVN
ncbi:hypothetical protein [Bradyrhizobium sp. Bra64]|uniref:hypothetical protein n=1 Tax=Bradyrhizobium sp. Bra64 TaxID=2926009 RepID=UPI002118131C|nr:hypothetical protein [Bradyrhizobium sp. Bra64]